MPTKGAHLCKNTVVDLSTFVLDTPVAVNLESVQLAITVSNRVRSFSLPSSHPVAVLRLLEMEVPRQSEVDVFDLQRRRQTQNHGALQELSGGFVLVATEH